MPARRPRVRIQTALLAVTLVVTLLFLAACTGLGGDAKQLALAPTVVGTGVQTNGVAPNRAIDVAFSKDIDPATVNAGTFLVSDAASKPVAGTVNYVAASRTASFKPTSDFAPSSQYSATITTGVADTAGHHLVANYSFKFTTRSSADTSPISVLSVTPPDGSTCLGQNTVVHVAFSEGADPSTVNSNTVKLNDETGPVAGAVTYDAVDNTATFTPSSPLAAQMHYSVVVNGVADLAGVAMTSEFIASFATGPCYSATPLLGTYQTFDYPGSTQTYLYGINDKGDIAGAYNDAHGQLHGFVFTGGQFTTLDYPGSIGTNVNGINNFGDVVGIWWNSTGPNSQTHSFVWHNGTFTAFDYPNAKVTLAEGINDSGVVVGQFQSMDLTQSHGFIRQPDGTIRQFDPPFASNGTSAHGINNNGDIAGNPAYVDIGGSFHQLPKLNGWAVGVRGLNIHDDVVGVQGTGVVGFLYKYSTGTYYSVIPPQNAHDTIAYGINSSGVIVGWYQDSAGNTHGYIATPQP